MLTRGYLVGEIIDDLSAIGNQVRMRNSVHMFDLTVVAENFFRDVLNILLDAKLKNLNAERSNEPGIDLGDDKLKIAFQITSSASTDKVNNTLKKITTAQKAKYDKFVVLGMNKRQKTYSLDVALTKTYKFSESDIWDLDTVASKAMNLEFDELQLLYKLIRKNSARLKIELEIPDENGKYSTSNYDLWEKLTKPKLGDGKAFRDFADTNDEGTPETQDVERALRKLGRELSRLPRQTREFLAILCEKRERKDSKRSRDGECYLLLSKARRQYHGDDFEGELEILQHAGFLSIDADDQSEQGPPQIDIHIPSDLDELRLEFVSFVETKKLSFRDVIGSIDLSAF